MRAARVPAGTLTWVAHSGGVYRLFRTQRAFDFQRSMRTFADDLACKDALNRTVQFLNWVVRAKGREQEY